MAFPVVIDACALYPYSLRDTLLRIAEAEYFDLFWSDEILDEVRRTLVKVHGSSEEQADRVINAMRGAFAGSNVPASAINYLLPAMANDDDDRHVLAAALAVKAELVVTFNLSDFAPEHTIPIGIEAIHPDQFLMIMFGLNPQGIVEILQCQADDFVDPPWTLEMLLDVLRKTVPEFVAAVESISN